MNAPERAQRAYSLRHLGRLVPLTDGEHLIGRDRACHFVIDDDLVSRTHARLLVNERGVVLEDLGSANGVFLNEARLRQPTTLQAGDRVMIGSCQMTVFDRGGDLSTRIISDTLPAQRVSSVPPASGVRVAAARRAAEQRTETTKADAFQLFGRLADQLLARGDAQGAARLLSGHVANVVRGARSARPLGDDLLDVAGRYCLKLAAATGDGVWVDRMIEMHSAVARPLSLDLARELAFILRNTSGHNRRLLQEYRKQMALLAQDAEPDIAERCALIASVDVPTG